MEETRERNSKGKAKMKGTRVAFIAGLGEQYIFNKQAKVKWKKVGKRERERESTKQEEGTPNLVCSKLYFTKLSLCLKGIPFKSFKFLFHKKNEHNILSPRLIKEIL
jgi:hypothetical protein